MGLISLLKKASLGLGGILLACNVGCNNTRFSEAPKQIRLEQAISKENLEKPKQRVRAWQYPANILGGMFISGSVHEGSHALAALSMGKEIEEICLPFIPNPYGRIFGYGICPELDDFSAESSNEERAFWRIAGTLGEVALIESISYNLRNGKISKNHQPFWATTSLVTRALMLNNAIRGLKPQDYLRSNDFRGFEYNSGITVEQSFSAVLAYTLLNSKNITKEFRTALGRKYYPSDSKKTGRLEVVPTGNGLGIQYIVDLN